MTGTGADWLSANNPLYSFFICWARAAIDFINNAFAATPTQLKQPTVSYKTKEKGIAGEQRKYFAEQNPLSGFFI